ncbi:PHD finger protein 1 [Ammospiza caudacuta]|uniref:PHD finger protein 1 n=1 Tax=Ammospiza caudacuta TaxID=2857398 RepID=UPI002739C333|nr:PHD finger protein 1 [Ammospiza caudacuta]
MAGRDGRGGPAPSGLGQWESEAGEVTANRSAGRGEGRRRIARQTNPPVPPQPLLTPPKSPKIPKFAPKSPLAEGAWPSRGGVAFSLVGVASAAAGPLLVKGAGAWLTALWAWPALCGRGPTMQHPLRPPRVRWRRPRGGRPPRSPPRSGRGQDVLARWTDGLLYLGVVKKVDASGRGCQIQFEDNSQFFVLWKDISPAAAPGGDPACCVCAGGGRNPENGLVRCAMCGHAYHQRCHAPPAPGGAGPWSCRRCVFAVATKRGGALRRGPRARAMLRMKSVLPYALGALDWDPPHLHNLQHCYCYCGGPGHWNLKMLQCRRCRQWFHEACTQCLPRPLLYGDRFYVFECSVCRGGAESVRRLPLRWVDVAHLLLYHLSVCRRRKYFDLEREILPLANRHWHALRLGTKEERVSELRQQLQPSLVRCLVSEQAEKLGRANCDGSRVHLLYK